MKAVRTSVSAAHGTNIDGTWMRPNVGRQLLKGNVVRFGASTRLYKAQLLPTAPASCATVVPALRLVCA